jgi:hypothetical protein
LASEKDESVEERQGNEWGWEGAVESPEANGVWGPRAPLGLVFASALNFSARKMYFAQRPSG